MHESRVVDDDSFASSLLDDKPYKCLECGSLFKRRDALKRHKYTHSNENPYKCVECELNFLSKEALEIHTIIHTGKHMVRRPFVCKECGAAYTRNFHLQRHILTHTGVRPYKCSECGHAFRSNERLSNHLRTHTGEKPFKCSQCSSRFSRKDKLNKHMRTHTGVHLRARIGDGPFNCLQCNSRFSRRDDLVKHVHEHSLTTNCNRCRKCESNFSSKYALGRHKNSCTSNSTSKCTKNVPGETKAIGWQSDLNPDTLVIHKVAQPTTCKHPILGKCSKENGCFRIFAGDNSNKCVDCGQNFSSKQCAVRLPRVKTSWLGGVPLQAKVKASDTKSSINVKGCDKQCESYNNGTSEYKKVKVDGENKCKRGSMTPYKHRNRKAVLHVQKGFKRPTSFASVNSRCKHLPRIIRKENRKIYSIPCVARRREDLNGRAVFLFKQTLKEYAKCSVKLTRINTKETSDQVGQNSEVCKDEVSSLAVHDDVERNESRNDEMVLTVDELVRQAKCSTKLATQSSAGKKSAQDIDLHKVFKENSSIVTDSTELKENASFVTDSTDLKENASSVTDSTELTENASFVTDSTEFDEVKLLESVERGAALIVNQLQECSDSSFSVSLSRFNRPTGETCYLNRQDGIPIAKEKLELDADCSTALKKKDGLVTDSSELDDVQPLVSIENGAVLIVHQLQECCNSSASSRLRSSGETTPQFVEMDEVKLLRTEEKALFHCQECGAVFSCVQSLVAHIRLHDPEERGGDDLPYYDF